MIYDLQRAMIWKRISAWLFDAILLSIAAVGIGFLLSSALHYDSYSSAMNQRYTEIQEEFEIDLSIGEEAYQRLSPEKQQAYLNAAQKIAEDGFLQKTYSMMMNLSLIIVSFGTLGGCLILEFLVPLVLGNGQTLGKKIFSIGVMSTNGIRVGTMQMFIRTVLGKYTIEIMLPLLVGMLTFFGSLGIYGTLFLLGLAVLQLAILAGTKTNALIHDLLAGTVAVDMGSQMIFETEKELLEYKNRVKADFEARKDN